MLRHYAAPSILFLCFLRLAGCGDTFVFCLGVIWWLGLCFWVEAGPVAGTLLLQLECARWLVLTGVMCGLPRTSGDAVHRTQFGGEAKMRLPAHFQVSIGDAVTYTLSGDSKEELHNQSGKESRAGQVLPCISGMA